MAPSQATPVPGGPEPRPGARGAIAGGGDARKLPENGVAGTSVLDEVWILRRETKALRDKVDSLQGDVAALKGDAERRWTTVKIATVGLLPMALLVSIALGRGIISWDFTLLREEKGGRFDVINQVVEKATGSVSKVAVENEIAHKKGGNIPLPRGQGNSEPNNRVRKVSRVADYTAVMGGEARTSASVASPTPRTQDVSSTTVEVGSASGHYLRTPFDFENDKNFAAAPTVKVLEATADKGPSLPPPKPKAKGHKMRRRLESRRTSSDKELILAIPDRKGGDEPRALRESDNGREDKLWDTDLEYIENKYILWDRAKEGDLNYDVVHLITVRWEFERVSLVTFYNKAGGQYWFDNTGWVEDSIHHCEWFGIVCNAKGYVTEINLASNGLKLLKGTLSEQIAALPGNDNKYEDIPGDMNMNDIYSALQEKSYRDHEWDLVIDGDLDYDEYISSYQQGIERINLEKFYNETGGQYWFDDTGWLEDTVHHCEWFGIACNNEWGSVTEINLRKNNLTNLFPGNHMECEDVQEDMDMHDVYVFIERSYLKEFYREAGGRYWFNNTGWLEDTINHCEWFGIACDEWSCIACDKWGHPNARGHVTRINLASNGLKGTLSEQIRSLSSLEVLDLCDNEMRGTIPTEIGNLRYLFTLRLCYNRFEGDMTRYDLHLNVLHLQGNVLSGEMTNVYTKKNFVADCGEPTDYELVCPDCTHCCNSQGECRNNREGVLVYHGNHIADTGASYSYFLDTFILLLYLFCFCGFLVWASFVHNKCCKKYPMLNGEAHHQPLVEQDSASTSALEPIEQDSVVSRFCARGGFWFWASLIIGLLLLFSIFPMFLFIASAAVLMMTPALYAIRSEAQQPPSTDSDDAYALKTIGIDSVYQFFLGKSWWGWAFSLATAGAQVFVLYPFLESVEAAYSWRCPRDQIDCYNTRELSRIGWVVFAIVMVVHLLKDFINGAKLINLSVQSRRPRLARLRYLFGGVVLMAVAFLTLWVSFLFNFITATSDVELIINSVVILFVVEVDEKLYKLLLRQGWVQKTSTIGPVDKVEGDESQDEEDDGSQVDSQPEFGNNLEGDAQALEQEAQSLGGVQQQNELLPDQNAKSFKTQIIDRYER